MAPQADVWKVYEIVGGQREYLGIFGGRDAAHAVRRARAYYRTTLRLIPAGHKVVAEPCPDVPEGVEIL